MNRHRPKGLSLIEAIISIGIIFTGLVGAMSLIIFSFRNSANAVNKVIAVNLAQEAVEVAINMRDSNDLADDPYDTGMVGDGTAILVFDELNNIWSFDFDPNSINDDAARLYSDEGLYKQSGSQGGELTIFRRLIQFDASTPGQLTVTATVRWPEQNGVKEVQAQRTLYNWRSAI